jgi:hypothetical protein
MRRLYIFRAVNFHTAIFRLGTDSEDGGKILLKDAGTSLPDYNIKTETIMRSETANIIRCYNVEIEYTDHQVEFYCTKYLHQIQNKKKTILSMEMKDISSESIRKYSFQLLFPMPHTFQAQRDS